MAAEMPDTAQSSDDGGQEQGGGPFDAVYEAVPHGEDAVREALKKAEAGITRNFQEHAEQRERFGGLEGIEGLQDIPPEDLGQLVELHSYMQDPESFEELWNAWGEEYGYFDDEDGEDGEGEDYEDDDEGEDDLASRVAQMVLEQVEGRIAPIEEGVRAGEEEQRIAQASQEVDRQLKALHEEHGELDEATEEKILRLALSYGDDDDAINRGAQDYFSIVGDSERGLLDRKSDQPSPGESGGRPNTAPDAIRNSADAKSAALSRFAAAS